MVWSAGHYTPPWPQSSVLYGDCGKFDPAQDAIKWGPVQCEVYMSQIHGLVTDSKIKVRKKENRKKWSINFLVIKHLADLA